MVIHTSRITHIHIRDRKSIYAYICPMIITHPCHSTRGPSCKPSYRVNVVESISPSYHAHTCLLDISKSAPWVYRTSQVQMPINHPKPSLKMRNAYPNAVCARESIHLRSVTQQTRSKPNRNNKERKCQPTLPPMPPENLNGPPIM